MSEKAVDNYAHVLKLLLIGISFKKRLMKLLMIILLQ